MIVYIQHFVRNFEQNVRNFEQNVRDFDQNVNNFEQNVRNFEQNVNNFEPCIFKYSCKRVHTASFVENPVYLNILVNKYTLPALW